MLRVFTEYCLRGFDLLSDLQDDLVRGAIFTTLVHDQAGMPGRAPVRIRELARRLGTPYETVRRQVIELVRAGQCREEGGGIMVPAAVRRSRRVAAFLRRLYLNTTRVLVDLTRVGMVRYGMKSSGLPRSGRLEKEQVAIARAGTAALLAGLKAMRTYWRGAMTKGLVYTAIWTANVKHVTNTATAGTRGLLQDKSRLPVNVMAIAQSLRLPYETVRRHAQALLKEGLCVRVGKGGLIVPAATHRRLAEGSLVAYRLMVDFLADLRQAGIRV
ncbi:hypothetical protein [Reyranella sp.]|uniref:hypothetical protein n=1 Tax=Reyranella sp. TaxID=1929291 RepID=UPI003BAA4499